MEIGAVLSEIRIDRGKYYQYPPKQNYFYDDVKMNIIQSTAMIKQTRNQYMLQCLRICISFDISRVSYSLH